MIGIYLTKHDTLSEYNEVKNSLKKTTSGMD